MFYKKIKMMQNNQNFKNKEGGRVVGGLILVAAGAVLLLRNTGFYMPNWLFSWPMILILIGIYSGFKHNFRNHTWIILIAIGGFFLVSKYIPQLGLEPLFWPLIVIGIGVILILRPGRKDFLQFKSDQKKDTWNATSMEETPNIAATDNSDFLMVRSVFSGVKRNVVSKNFKGGHISSVFGGAEIDLSQAEINGQVIIKFEVLFGGAKLVVPSHWAVQNEIDGVFHGVDDNRRYNPDAGLNPGKVLILKGSAIFGGIEIRSF